MKTVEQLDHLSSMIGEAIRNYHQAIAENLQELGHPVTIQDLFNEYDRGITLDITDDKKVIDARYDQIRCKKGEDIEVHCFSWNYAPVDEWVYLSLLGDAAKYLLEAIYWINPEKLMKIDGDAWSGTANEIYSFSNADIALYFIYEDGRIEDIAWRRTIDEIDGTRGYFAVEKEQYDEAIRQIENHYNESR